MVLHKSNWRPLLIQTSEKARKGHNPAPEERFAAKNNRKYTQTGGAEISPSKGGLYMKDRYVYPAIFDYADDGISVEFPDLPGALTSGDSDEEALHMAKDCLALHLYGMEQDGDAIPEPSRAASIVTEANQVVVLIDVWMPPFRDNMAERAVKKTLTIPKWLDDIAAENKVNYSHILQDALKEYLGVSERKKLR